MEIQFNSDMYAAAAKHIPSLHLREGLYLQALRKAQSAHGPNSLEVGLVLLDLSDCVQAQGQQPRADGYADRAFVILRQFIKSRPELLSAVWSMRACLTSQN